MDESFYSVPRIYDIAFGFRDVPTECDFLCEVARRHGCGTGSFLELAAGPAAHAREMARRAIPAAALDLSAPMIEYARAEAEAEGLELQAVVGDMRSFELDRRFAFAATLIDSTAHLLTNDDFVQFVDTVARHLEPRGIHVLEMCHPADHYAERGKDGARWTETRDGLVVEASFKDAADPFDPITQLEKVSVRITARDEEGVRGRIQHTLTQRRYTWQTLQALLAQSRYAEPVAWYGALDTTVAFDNGPQAWRMVVVLGRR